MSGHNGSQLNTLITCQNVVCLMEYLPYQEIEYFVNSTQVSQSQVQKKMNQPSLISSSFEQAFLAETVNLLNLQYRRR